MNSEKHKLIIDGNAFYELDLECIKKQKGSCPNQNREKELSGSDSRQKRQRK
ncbi:hypothetical protein [Blautia sp. MSJ-19]|uniref:hypothetical protein n=1 Tax=Blautia sp. MSJ-19 TaxID=2841517 RepID=UPI001C0EF4D3|nr:hypothetical protein [Blautia sp. MSJ-19]MBU5481899.1 hypothetical protein [Blautia sp. MSJ-19]